VEADTAGNAGLPTRENAERVHAALIADQDRIDVARLEAELRRKP
jgi:hypothetical protein